MGLILAKLKDTIKWGGWGGGRTHRNTGEIFQSHASAASRRGQLTQGLSLSVDRLWTASGAAAGRKTDRDRFLDFSGSASFQGIRSTRKRDAEKKETGPN